MHGPSVQRAETNISGAHNHVVEERRDTNRPRVRRSTVDAAAAAAAANVYGNNLLTDSSELEWPALQTIR
jgi:hypothetical protein